MEKLNNILNALDPISLKEMDRVNLQNRTDTKFVFNGDLLPIILNDIKSFYSILEIKEKFLAKFVFLEKKTVVKSWENSKLFFEKNKFCQKLFFDV